MGRVRVDVTAGPQCPVVQEGQECPDRPVADAVLRVSGPTGGELRSDDRGRAEMWLNPGSYTLEPQPVEGLMGTPGPVAFTIREGQLTSLAVSYDTGIR